MDESEHYHIASTVQVDAFSKHSVKLATIFGRVPEMRLFVTILESPWAEARGWRCLQPGLRYRLTIQPEMALDFVLDTSDEIKLERHMFGSVQENDQVAQQALFDALLGRIEGIPEIRNQYNTAFHEVNWQVVALALEQRAQEQSVGPVNRMVIPRATGEHEVVFEFEVLSN